MEIAVLLLFFLLIIAGFLFPKSKTVSVFIFIFIWLIVGLNTYTPDYAIYEYVYKQISNGNIFAEFEPVFSLLMYSCGFIGLSFQGFRIVFGFIYALLVLYAAKRLADSKEINITLALFMLWPLIPNVSGIRFSLSSIIVCCFIPELINSTKKGTRRYIFGVILAMLIHMSSAFYLILIFARKKFTTLKQVGIFGIIASAILVLYSNIPALVINMIFDGVTARKLTMWLVVSSNDGFQHNSILGFTAFSLFVIAFTVLVCLISKWVIKAYSNENMETSLCKERINLYKNISFCLLLTIPGFVIAGIYERYLFGILPVYYSVFSEFRKNRELIKSKYILMYSFGFICLVIAEIAFYIYSNTYVSGNFNLYDVFKNNLLVSGN